MNILVIGDQNNLQECRQKFGDKHEYSWVEEHRDAEKFLQSNSLVFDFIVDEEPHMLEMNTIPGLTTESLIPQQARAAGISLEDLFTNAIELAL